MSADGSTRALSGRAHIRGCSRRQALWKAVVRPRAILSADWKRLWRACRLASWRSGCHPHRNTTRTSHSSACGAEGPPRTIAGPVRPRTSALTGAVRPIRARHASPGSAPWQPPRGLPPQVRNGCPRPDAAGLDSRPLPPQKPENPTPATALSASGATSARGCRAGACATRRGRAPDPFRPHRARGPLATMCSRAGDGSRVRPSSSASARLPMTRQLALALKSLPQCLYTWIYCA